MTNDERDNLPSASATQRLMNCAASHHMTLLARGMRQEAGEHGREWAEQGEQMHRAVFDQSDAKLETDQERMDYAKMMRRFRDFLGSWGATNNDIVIREERLWLHHEIFPIFSGRPDYIRISPNYKRAAIVDFKSLWNRVPEPAENDQLISQAVLLAEAEPDIEVFTLQILSPHYNYKAHIMHIDEVRAYEVRLREMIDKVNSKTEPNPGEWCKHCGGLLVCPKVRKEASDLIKGPHPSELPLENAGKLLSQLERLEKFLEEVKSYYKRVLADQPDAVPGWTLTTKVLRTLRDPAKVMAKAVPIIGEEKFWGSVSISVVKLEAAWEKAEADPHFNEVLAPFVTSKETAPSLSKAKKKYVTGTKESNSTEPGATDVP